MKKHIVRLIIFCLAFCTIAVNCFAWSSNFNTLPHDQTVKSYLNFNSTFTGSKRKYSYRHVGYEYNNANCENSKATFDVELWQDVGALGKNTLRGTCVDNPGTTGYYWLGLTFYNSNSGGGKMWFKFRPQNNGNKRIICDKVVMFSNNK